MSSLGKVYETVGKFELALPICEESVKLAKINLGENHFHTIGMMNNLAGVYLTAGKLDQALPVFQESLQLHKVNFGPDHSDTILTQVKLGDRVTLKLAGSPSPFLFC